MSKTKSHFKKAIAMVMISSVMTAGTAVLETNFTEKVTFANTIVAEAADPVYGNYTYKVEADNTVTLTGYKGSETVITDIPTSINGKSVTRLKYTFSYCPKITKVTIPDSITEIGVDTFFRATSLTTVIFHDPDKIKTIGPRAFQYSGLSSISLGSNVTSIEPEAFANCKNLKSFVWPTTVNTISPSVFDQSGLSSITIPSNVTEIGANAFNECLNLQSLSVQGTCKIGRSAFASCEHLTNVSISKNCTLNDNSFGHCTELKNVEMTSDTFNSGLKNKAFTGCVNLRKIKGKSITQKNTSGKPYFLSAYNSSILENWAAYDSSKVGFYTDYLNAEVAYIVNKETAGCTTDSQKIRKLHDWLCKNVEYSKVNGEPDPSRECHVDSSAFMNKKADGKCYTVCDGYARALTLLLREAGIETFFVEGKVSTSVDPHAWVIVKLGKYYFQIDPTWDDGGDLRKYYLKSDMWFMNNKHLRGWRITTPTYSRIRNGITYTPNCYFSIGDLNKDGKVNGTDKLIIQNHIARSQLIPTDDLVLADLFPDGVIDIGDLVEMSYMYGVN